MRRALDRPLLLRGNVVSADGRANDRYILVESGLIRTVSRGRPPSPPDTLFVEAGRNDLIFPGLLDLHTHAAYNILPLWSSPNGPFGNRFDWRNDAGYKRDVRGVFSKLRRSSAVTLDVFAELQAVAGGTTLLQEGKRLDAERSLGGGPVLCRGTGDNVDLGTPPTRSLSSVLDFFRPSQGRPKGVSRSINAYLTGRRSGSLIATLAHLAEGRAGFWHAEGADPYTRLEMEAFMAHKAFQDASAVRSAPLTLIHACGVDTDNEEHLAFLRDRDIGVIWSPVSNLLLYEDTLDVERFLEAGIRFALGSDWSPSGSKHVWDEAKFARFLVEVVGANVSDEQIFRMVTTDAARCIGLRQAGRIEEGCFADFLVLRTPLESDNPLEVFFRTGDQHVRAVIVAGRPIYGDHELLAQFHLPLQALPRVEGRAVTSKVAHLPPELGIDLGRDIGRLEEKLKEQGQLRSNLLVDSDTPYRSRIRKLKGQLLRRGEQLQRRIVGRRWSQRSPSLPVPADAVRVWRGFRLPDLPEKEFLSKLETVFIPGTAVFQRPLGLTAYLPVVPPGKRPDTTPDELALVFYESQEVYGDTFQTLIGRAYGDLHATIFDLGRSRSGFPKKLTKALKPSQPYYLLDRPVDWQVGSARMFMGLTGSTNQQLVAALREIANAPAEGLDGAIFVIDPDCVVYWEHWEQGAEPSDEHLEGLRGLCEEICTVDARPTKLLEVGRAASLPKPLRVPAGFNFQFPRRYHDRRTL